MIKLIFQAIKCHFGFHMWKNIDTNPTPNPPEGGSVAYSELHECTECKKQEFKGMGVII